MASKQAKNVAIIGTGPAALMAASQLAALPCSVSVFEKNPGAARKLLIAGGSGLNISNNLPQEEFAAQYAGDGIDWRSLLQNFSVDDWLAFARGLQLETFLGTSGRYFVREMKASGLVTAWLADLKSKGVTFHFRHELSDIDRTPDGRYELAFGGGTRSIADMVVLALGGASWLPEGEVLKWPNLLGKLGIQVSPFAATNCGYAVEWKKEFLAEAKRAPLKNVTLLTAKGSKKGDILITEYGVEGTPVYACGYTGLCHIDLKPDLDALQVLEKLRRVQENLSPLRRAKRVLALSEAAIALLYHHSPADAVATNEGLAKLIKAFPLELLAPRPLTEAISSSGGVKLDELTPDFELRGLPGVFAVGEMLDWSAPTGGFLIQACVSQAAVAGRAIAQRLAAR
ncbi:MAG TPA: TIGR03862 family flavoprotein [Turneriella sp.]|nr:TIGR03862 family flavoprotein [Turneriella sp.]